MVGARGAGPATAMLLGRKDSAPRRETPTWADTAHTQPTREADCMRYHGAGRNVGGIDSAEPSSFAGLLRRYRTAARLTQDELAERAGVSTRGIQDLERAVRRNPHPDTVRRLIAALGLGHAERAQLFGALDRTGSGCQNRTRCPRVTDGHSDVPVH